MTRTRLILAAALAAAAAAAEGSVYGSKHDLDQARAGTGPCDYCHVPHQAAERKGLSNRPTSSASA